MYICMWWWKVWTTCYKQKIIVCETSIHIVCKKYVKDRSHMLGFIEIESKFATNCRAQGAENYAMLILSCSNSRPVSSGFESPRGGRPEK